MPEAAWHRLERPAAYQSVADQRRTHQPDRKAAIVHQRGYLNLQLNYEDVAEFDYQPGKCTKPYRVIALRKNISESRGDHVLFNESRYFFYITTRRDLTAAEVVYCTNQRCDQENVIELKNGVGALRVPLYDLTSNWAYMVVAALAWNLKSWFAMLLHRKTNRREFIALEFRRFIHTIILIPAQVSRRARSITICLTGWQPSLDRKSSAWRTIERTGFT